MVALPRKITFWTIRAGYVQDELLIRNKVAPEPVITNSYLPKFRARLSFWQEANMVQVLLCTWYAEILKPY